MQNYQQWLQNKTYEMHLNSLTKIKESKRKELIKSAVIGKNHPRHTQDDEDHFSPSPKKNKHKNRYKLPLKQKNLLWQNFLLGKRIIETNPVIMQKKQIDSYNRNRKILDLRTKVAKRSESKSNFRQSKLKEFTQTTFRINEKFRLETACRLKRILAFRIVDFEFLKMKIIPFQDLFIKYKFEGKANAKKTEVISLNSFFNYTFYLTLSRHKKQNTIMVIELYDMRGLKEVFIGSLNLDLNQENEYSFSNTLTSNVSKLGKKVGCLHFKCEIIRKEDIGNKI